MATSKKYNKSGNTNKIRIPRLSILSSGDYQIIAGYHKDHIIYNFPDSLFNEKLFKAELNTDIKNSYAYLFFAKGGEGKVIGFLWLRVQTDPYKVPKPYRYVDLHYIHVDSRARSKGVGSTLMEFTNKFAAKKHCKEIRLGTHVANRHARNLYKKFGFEEYRITMRKLL